MTAAVTRPRSWWGVVVLAALAYVPALSAGHGRMPADTKLYLYLDPGRLIGDAPFTFDPRQFGGWVPHQTISYLWPSGPWFWTFERLGVPDWVAHRLWIGTILFVAALGVRWLCRMFGFAEGAALVAAAIYALTPFVLPYLSRTSLMLLPYASLGWIVGLTVRAATRSTWRHAALLALVVATVGAPNATAIAMIAPAPVLWLLHAAWGGEVTWRRAAATAGRIALLCVPVSLWWLAMLAVQGRYGADVLAYSETLEAVSLTSLSTETLRGMGYWLFYVRDPVGFTTSAAVDYMSSGWLIVTSFVLTGFGIAGFGVARFRARRFAVALVVVGIVLAVGVHPIDDPSPLMSPFADSSRSTVVLALRSSTRALPMAVLGLAIGAAALVAVVAQWVARRPNPASRFGWAPVAVVVAIAAANLPAAWNGGFVDPVISRDQDPPAAWFDAAAALDAMPAGFRVLQAPGMEFGAYTWGYTADPPLPGLTERPLVTRDLLPLGSPAAMDLLYALDDRFQEGTVEGDSVAPVARLLGVDTVWVPNDVWFDRYRTPRPEQTAALFAALPDGMGEPVAFGEPFVPTSVLATVDEDALGDPRVGTPLEPVWLVPVTDPVPVVRAKTDVVAVAGSGDGVVDAAAAGLLDGTELVVYTSALPDEAVPDRLLVTDTNRDQARHWRSSQDTRGFTEDGADASGVLRDDTADQRLVWGDEAPEHRTAAVQEGPVTIAASAYGEPFAYRPEDRAYLAIDGDPATAWRVADRADARGEWVELTTASAVDTLALVQPATGSTGLAPNRWITEIDVSVDGSAATRVALDDSSRTPDGQVIDLPAAGTSIVVAIAATADAPPDPIAPARPDAVGFAEIRTRLGPTVEVVRPPTAWLDRVGDDVATTILLTRQRADATNRWRRDPEPALVRDVVVPASDHTVDVTIRLDRRAGDDVLAALTGWTGATASQRLTGVPTAGGWAAVDGDAATSWVSPFGAPVGGRLTVPLAAGTTTVAELAVQQPAGDYSPITSLTIEGDGASVTVTLPPPDPEGWSRVTFEPLPVAAGMTVVVDGADVRTTSDRRSAELVALPTAIRELAAAGIEQATLPAEIALGCRDDLLTIDGEPVGLDLGTMPLAPLLAGDPLVVAASACDGDAAVTVRPGERRIVATPSRSTGLHVDRVVLSPAGAVPPGTAPADAATSSDGLVPTEVVERGRTSRRVEVAPCPDGCWIVLGEGHNDGWTARLEGGGGALGDQAIVDGGFAGWWLPPSDTTRTVTFSWTPQRTVSIALVVSVLAVVACLVLALVDRRRLTTRSPRPVRWCGWRADPRVSRWSPAVVTAVVALAIVDPVWSLAGAAIGAVAGLARRPRLLVGAAFALWGWCGLVVLWRVRRDVPFPSAAWPGNFEDLHRPGMFVLALVAGSLVARDERRPARRPPSIDPAGDTAGDPATDRITVS